MNPILCGIKQFPIEQGRYIVLLFKTNQFHGSLSSSQEGEMKWVDRNDLLSLNLVEDFMELLEYNKKVFGIIMYIIQKIYFEPILRAQLYILTVILKTRFLRFDLYIILLI